MATITVIRHRQPSVQESLSPQQLREWAIWWGSPGGGASRARRRKPLSPQQRREWAVRWGATTGGTCESTPAGSAATSAGAEPEEALHTFTLDSGTSRCFFRDSTIVRPLTTPVLVTLADRSGGPVVVCGTTVLPCPTAPSGLLTGLHLPSFAKNLMATSVLQDQWVTVTQPGGELVAICTDSCTGEHLATFTRRPGSGLYTLTTDSALVAESGQVAASVEVAASCSCRLLTHQTLLWHHRLGHPSLPRLRGMHFHLLVLGLPNSLLPLSRSLALPYLPCVEGRQRATPHSSFPPTSAPLQTLHMDVWGPAHVTGQGGERYFLLVVDDYTRYTTVSPLRIKADVRNDLPVLRLHSDRGGEFFSRLLEDFCGAEGIVQSYMLPASPQQNGISERRISLWMGEVGDASAFWVWGSLSLVHDLPAGKLSPRTLRCVFLGFPTDAPPWQFYHPCSRRVLSSCDVTFDESVCFYRLHPHRSSPVPLPPLSLVDDPPPVAPLPPPSPAPAGVSQVDSPLLVEPLEVSSDTSGPAEGGDQTATDTVAPRCSTRLAVPPGFPPRPSSPPLWPIAVDSGAFRGGDIGGADSGGAGSGGAASPTGAGGAGGAEAGGSAGGGAGGAGAGGAGVCRPGGGVGRARAAGSGGAGLGGASAGVPGVGRTGGTGTGGTGARQQQQQQQQSSRDVLSPQQLREWYTQRPRGGAFGPCTYVLRTGDRAGEQCGGTHSAHRCFRRLTDAWRQQFPEAVETPRWGELSRAGVAIFDLDFDAILAHFLTLLLCFALLDWSYLLLVLTSFSFNHPRSLPFTGATGGTGGAGPVGASAFVPRVGGTGGADAGGATGGTGVGGASRQKSLLPQQLRAWAVCWGSSGGEVGGAGSGGAVLTGTCGSGGVTTQPQQSALHHLLSLPPAAIEFPTAGTTPPLLFPPTDQSQPQLLPGSPLPAPAPHMEVTEFCSERREPETRASTPIHGRRTIRPRAPAAPGTHRMALCPSSVPQRVVLPSPLASSLPHVPDPESDLVRTASPTVTRLLATVVTDPSFESAAVFSLFVELVDFAALCRLDYAASLVFDSSCPSSVRSELALGCDVLEDRQFELEVKRPPGSPPAFKARYVARGFSQIQHDYELHSLDFSAAFLQGSLHEAIWLRCPRGFTGSFLEGTQWSLRRPVYGLRQAPREWYDTLRTTHAALGFAPSIADPSLFLRTDTSLPPFYVLVSFSASTSHGPRHSPLLCLPATCSQLHLRTSPTLGMGLVLGGRVQLFSLVTQTLLGCEAEIYAGAMAAQELRWLTYLLTDLGEQPRSPPVTVIARI
ncbi:unnamed protein product [Closterium sp. NIES-53]